MSILEEDRIDAMRGRIDTAVAADVRRRSRRARGLLGAAGAVVAVSMVWGIGSHLPHTSSDTAASDSSASEAMAPAPAADSAGGTDGLMSIPGKAAGDSEGEQRDVITTGTVDVTVSDPADSAEAFAAWVERAGGRIDAQTEEGDGDHRHATVTARVRDASAAVAQLGRIGDTTSVEVAHNDVTSQAVDLDARIGALRISIARLEKILASAATSKDVIAAESALTDRQKELESYQAQRTALGDQVDLATLDVTFHATRSATTPDAGGFGGGLVDGWNALVAFTNGTVTLAGVLLPWAGLAAVLGGIAWGLRGWRRRRSGF